MMYFCGPTLNGRIHELKISEEFFGEVKNEWKTQEVRKKDREFKVGDYIALNEISDDGSYTRNHCLAYISHILDDERYCKEGYVILSISLCRIEHPVTKYESDEE